MTRLSLVVSAALASLLAGCGQLSEADKDPRQNGANARYVDPTALTVGGAYADEMVISVVPVQHGPAEAAEAALKQLQIDGLAIRQVGNKEIVFQGPGNRVADAIRVLKRFDVAPIRK